MLTILIVIHVLVAVLLIGIVLLAVLIAAGYQYFQTREQQIEENDYGDLLEMGVVDPTKVTRTALQNAASVASLMLTTDAMVAEQPEDKPAAGGMPGGMGGMGGMGDMGM